MTVSKAKKSETLTALKADLTRAKSFALVQSNRITVAEVSKVRRGLLPVQGKMIVAKKTLIQLAAKEIKSVDIPDDMLPGQVAILMAFDDAVAPLSVVNALAKEFEGTDKLVFTGSYLDGSLQDAQTTKKLASLPSRDVLLAKFMGSLLSPVSSLARFFDGAKQKLEETGKTTLSEIVVASAS
jgi:large subunit ribosomal protein L10